MLLISIIALLALLALSIPIGAGLFILAYLLDEWFAPAPLIMALGSQLWGTSTNFILLAIPLFILIGEILMRSGIAEKMYEALDSWLSWMPGGLMHANIGAATLFAATSGSSVATAATIGTIALPQSKRFGYNDRLFAGSIAAGGTLGILIPPSINMILYGFLAQASVPQLFLAGIIPGIILSSLFILVVFILCLFNPAWGGARRKSTAAVRLRGLLHLIPVFALFAFIIGSMYSGWATPTEAAAVGVITALLLAVAFGTASWRMLVSALEGTMRTTSMIMLILLGATFLNFVLASIGLTDALLNVVTRLNIGPSETLFLLIGFYVVLGCFIETLSLMVITIPIVAPLMVKLGFDPVWFGVVVIVLIEMALITPPVGMNLYVVQGVRQRGTLTDVMIGAAPFVVAMFAMIGLLIAFPDLALFIPRMASG
jgi:tripartite ATP-independent transporter DctM subunit